MSKTVQLDKFLQEHQFNTGYSQFTIDWIEETQERIEELQREQSIAEADFLHALHYDVDNILGIMRTELSDCAFYQELGQLLSRLADKADAQNRYERRISKAGLN